MRQEYPLSVIDERKLPEDYAGPVFVWDIDKTYLSTRFSSLRGLSRIPFEWAVDKRAIPGMPEILRGLRHGPLDDYACHPLYFISASPPLIRKSLRRKMQLDGVEFDGITFKDWFETVKQLRPGRLREQVGYKLCALFDGRSRRAHATEYLFGDDVEFDALSFSLYADMLAGQLSPGEAEQRLEQAGVPGDDRARIHALRDRLPRQPGQVAHIFIHLEHGSDPARFAEFGSRLSAVKGACQLAFALFEQGLISAEFARQACRATSTTRLRHAYSDPDALRADALHRGLISEKRLTEIGPIN